MGFLFYLTFGIVIVEAVNISGILTVFAFLILPAAFSSLFSKSWTSRIIIGFVLGAIVSAFGLYFSWTMDVPVAPLIIISMGVLLILGGIFKKVISLKNNKLSLKYYFESGIYTGFFVCNYLSILCCIFKRYCCKIQQ